MANAGYPEALTTDFYFLLLKIHMNRNKDAAKKERKDKAIKGDEISLQ